MISAVLMVVGPDAGNLTPGDGLDFCRCPVARNPVWPHDGTGISGDSWHNASLSLRRGIAGLQDLPKIGHS